MPPISRILVPVDFSARCLGMMPYVKALARQYQAEVVLLHVVNPVYAIPETGISAPVLVPVPQWFLAEKEREVERFAVAELEGIRVRRLTYEGEPEAQIAAFTKAEDVQLVIMPTHGHGILRRYLIGSVTAKVLHDVTCPVLTGTHMETHDSLADVKISHVACAVDLSAHSYVVLAWASGLAADFGAKLSLLHVMTSSGPDLDQDASAGIQRSWEDAVRAELDKLQAAVGVPAANICIPRGNVAREVCGYAKSLGAGLLVIGRSVSDADSGGRLRTNSYSIIRLASCPVASV
ncbi:MAG: universal stress protein [Acidobacteriaceae bacterium]|nr:universal stress protein [Acidobacteriaceae bacterium]MBV8572412.1 universal stress protein [Acidobacteriaceae bacterium]